MERSPERGAVDCHVAVDCPAGLERGRLPLQRSLAWGRDERAAAPSAAEAETGGPRDESPIDLLTQARTDGGVACARLGVLVWEGRVRRRRHRPYPTER